MLEHGAENGLWYSAGDHHLVRQLGLVQQLTDQKPVESYAIANVPPSSGAFYPKIRPTFTRTRARNYSTVIQCISSSWSKVFVTGGSSWTGLATTSEIASRRVTEARSVMIDGNGRAVGMYCRMHTGPFIVHHDIMMAQEGSRSGYHPLPKRKTKDSRERPSLSGGNQS